MNGLRMYEWIIRFKDNDGIFKEAGGLMIAKNTNDVMNKLMSNPNYNDCIEFNIKRSDMSVLTVLGHGVIYKTLWVYNLPKDEVKKIESAIMT